MPEGHIIIDPEKAAARIRQRIESHRNGILEHQAEIDRLEKLAVSLKDICEFAEDDQPALNGATDSPANPARPPRPSKQTEVINRLRSELEDAQNSINEPTQITTDELWESVKAMEVSRDLLMPAVRTLVAERLLTATQEPYGRRVGKYVLNPSSPSPWEQRGPEAPTPLQTPVTHELRSVQ